ncbi:hypothetical protein [Bradymonas sediminis]|uniref:Uncharacterized protein n=1 Tax=Bradymonas sediminis TaxID=1548548 RepID=A0A2Z4FNU0_9DELT|nr:hypothetical protein [Bradymonas sediminis]AWV90613.1 hypothetical protein DN745_15285 [Bradymonas sediminis]TDP62389.1 hypothetical protein DFR33_11352 [Bradymonas sediminis]
MKSRAIPNLVALAAGVHEHRRVGRALVLLFVLLFSSACPGYEDGYSGTFRENIEASGRNGDALAVDLFRFGDNVSAILRVYQRDPITGDPFGKQKLCVWSDAQSFDSDANKFRLYINKESRQIPRSQLFGTLHNELSMDITLYEESTSAPFDGIEALRMERVSEEPDVDCQSIDDTLIKVSFPRDPDSGATQKMPAAADYDIHNPVLTVAWVGVQPAAGSSQLAAVNRQTPAIPLDDGFGTNFDAQQHALKNERRFAVAPPPDVVRMASGQTTLALGHFAVVDDSEADRPEDISLRDWQFSWDVVNEKLVASSLRPATRPYCDRGTDQWGTALLFVEGSLNDLSRTMRSEIQGAESCAENNRCDEHFYLVDVCSEGDQVLNIELHPTPAHLSTIGLFVTDQFLQSTTIPLPRVNPYQLWR